jgi:hypothetical protein
MPVSVEVRSLNRAIDDLRSAVASLHGKYGEVSTVKRLRNDLERLVLDVADVDSLPPVRSDSPGGEILQLTDEPYDSSMWAEDADDEGLGGYHGGSR